MTRYHKSIAWATALAAVFMTLIISLTTFFISLKEYDLQMARLKAQTTPQVTTENETP